jgi:hypothetical protein
MGSNAALQKRKLIDAGLASDADFLGCSEAEITHLEQQFKVKLPPAFVDFLQVMGKERDGFYAEASMSYPFDDMRRIAVALLDDVNEKLSETAFVFVERYGCAVLYFETNVGDDPPVYVCQEDDNAPSKVAGSFSVWLNSAVDEHIAGCRKLKELEKR